MKPNWFIALPVDPGRWLASLGRTAPSGVRVFHPRDVHLTVAFLGSCRPEQAQAAWASVAGAELGPFPIELGKLALMGNPRRASALSVIISQGAEPVAELIGTLRQQACRVAAVPCDERPPLPHITVARIRRKADRRQRAAAIEWAAGQAPVGASIELDRLALYTWADDRRERQFRVVAATREGSP